MNSHIDYLQPIDRVAELFHLSPSSLIFWEDCGLLHPYRLGEERFYSNSDLLRIKIVMKGKSLGFDLVEIKSLIDASAKTRTSRAAESEAEASTQLRVDTEAMSERETRDEL